MTIGHFEFESNRARVREGGSIPRSGSSDELKLDNHMNCDMHRYLLAQTSRRALINNAAHSGAVTELHALH